MKVWAIGEDEEADWYVEAPDGHRFYFGNIEGVSKCCFENARYIVEACNKYDRIRDIVKEDTDKEF